MGGKSPTKYEKSTVDKKQRTLSEALDTSDSEYSSDISKNLYSYRKIDLDDNV